MRINKSNTLLDYRSYFTAAHLQHVFCREFQFLPTAENVNKEDTDYTGYKVVRNFSVSIETVIQTARDLWLPSETAVRENSFPPRLSAEFCFLPRVSAVKESHAAKLDRNPFIMHSSLIRKREIKDLKARCYKTFFMLNSVEHKILSSEVSEV